MSNDPGAVGDGASEEHHTEKIPKPHSAFPINILFLMLQALSLFFVSLFLFYQSVKQIFFVS